METNFGILKNKKSPPPPFIIYKFANLYNSFGYLPYLTKFRNIVTKLTKFRNIVTKSVGQG